MFTTKVPMKYAEIEQDVKNRLEYLLNYKPTKVIDDVLNMDSQACYDLFGIPNNNLEDVSTLIAMLNNGLYDDSSLSFYKDKGFYYIGYPDNPDDLDTVILEEDLQEMVRLSNLIYNYYKDNSDVINTHKPLGKVFVEEYKGWRKLQEDLDTFKSKFGWEPSDISKESRIRIAEMYKRLGVNK